MKKKIEIHKTPKRNAYKLLYKKIKVIDKKNIILEVFIFISSTIILLFIVKKYSIK